MFSRPLKIVIAAGCALGLFAAIVAVNARHSWRPVSVDFGVPFGASSPQYLPLAWWGNNLWLLAGTEGTISDKALPTVWRVARNWNRTPFSIVQTAFHDHDLVALNAANGDFIRADGETNNPSLQIWRGRELRRWLREKGRRNRYGLMNSWQPRLISFSPDGTRIITSSYLSGLHDIDELKTGFHIHGAVLFDAQDGKQIVRQSASEGCFTDFAWSPDSKEVAGIAADGWVFILNGKSGKLRLKFRAHQLFGAQIAWTSDGKTLVTATNPRVENSPTGLAYDFKSGEDISMNSSSSAMMTGTGKTKRVIASDAKGDTTWNGRTERTLKRFDARTSKPIGTPLPLQTGAVDMAFSPDGEQLALGEHDFVLILNAQTLATERRLTIPTSIPNKVALPVCVAWSSDSATLATSTTRGLTLWRMR